MPLPLPNLDTRTFDDLVAEMRTLIPHYTPEWTNHNPSDPGITLVELMAWITESTLYRLNRIPEATYRKFIAFLLGEAPQQDESLESAKLRAVRFFEEPYRAVTAADFEREAKRASTDVARVRVLANATEGRVTVVVVPAAATLEYKAKEEPVVEEGRMTAVFVPKTTAAVSPDPLLKDPLLETVKKRLSERKLVGTQLLVTRPIYKDMELEITVQQKPNTIQEEIKDAVAKAAQTFLDPLTGGPEGAGWPFDRPVSEFELYHVIEPISGVHHVEKIVMKENGVSVTGEIALQDLDLPLLQSLTVEVVSPL